MGNDLGDHFRRGTRVKVYIVLSYDGGDEAASVDRVYSHPDDAEKRCNTIFSLQRDYRAWWEAQSPAPSEDQWRSWAAEHDAVDLIEDLDRIRNVGVEVREVYDPPVQYVEYCQLDYKVDCHKPNLGGPESHMRIAANVNDVDIVDGRVRHKPRNE